MRHKCLLVLILALFGAGCGGGAADSNRAAVPTASPEAPVASPSGTPLTGFEKDLQYVRNGGFTYIWIFSRKDGKTLDKEDGAFLRTNAPQVVDWVTTEEGKKVIGGTNFNLEEGNLAALKTRFVAEDYSAR